MLRGLRRAGFDTVMATPHMRPGMFENDRPALQAAFEAMRPHVDGQSDLPAVFLSSEHWFDEIVFTRLVQGEGLPYPDVGPARTSAKKRGVLVELPPQRPNPLCSVELPLTRGAVFRAGRLWATTTSKG